MICNVFNNGRKDTKSYGKDTLQNVQICSRTYIIYVLQSLNLRFASNFLRFTKFLRQNSSCRLCL